MTSVFLRLVAVALCAALVVVMNHYSKMSGIRIGQIASVCRILEGVGNEGEAVKRICPKYRKYYSVLEAS